MCPKSIFTSEFVQLPKTCVQNAARLRGHTPMSVAITRRQQSLYCFGADHVRLRPISASVRQDY